MRSCLRGGLAASVLAFSALLLCSSLASAQAHARFRQPDSLLAGAIRAAGADFEAAWNSLLISELRATQARADSAVFLRALESRIAAREEEARDGHIARDALALRARWNRSQLRLRVEAAVRESLAVTEQARRRFDRADSLLQPITDCSESDAAKRGCSAAWGCWLSTEGTWRARTASTGSP